MIRLTAVALLLGLAGAAQAAEVYKCRVGDKIQYSDQPCAAKGEALTPRQLQSNVVDTSGDRRRHQETLSQPPVQVQDTQPPAPTPDARPGNVCPSDRDIVSMETRANSNSLSPEAKRFMQDEIRRARQCQKGQGSYSAADWAISRQAQDAQSSLTGGADARRRAEAMHSAADPSEGDRIARQQEAADRAAARQQRREQEGVRR